MSETMNANGGELDDPIKIRWSGKARRKIEGRAADGAVPDSETVSAVLDRQKTNVVLRSVGEAETIAELMSRYTNEGGNGGRGWVNGAIASACERVEGEIIDGMAERGYEAERGVAGVGGFVEGEPEPEFEPGDTVRCFGDTYTVESVEDGFVRTEDGGALSTEGIETVDE